MRTIEKILEEVPLEALDGRDRARLMEFLTFEQADKLLKRTNGEWQDAENAKSSWEPPKPFTEEEIKKQLAKDVDFGFQKALNQRGISAGFMHQVVLMWMWILEDPLYDEHRSSGKYAQYGLPLFRAVAMKYGFPNEIGENTGSEDKYGSD